MTMTRKDFQRLAETLAEIQYYLDNPTQAEIAESAIMRFCEGQNPNFDRVKFQRATDIHLQETQERMERYNARLAESRRKAREIAEEIKAQEPGVNR